MRKNKYVNFARRNRVKSKDPRQKRLDSKRRGNETSSVNEPQSLNNQQRKPKVPAILSRCSVNDEEKEIKDLQQQYKGPADPVAAQTIETFEDFPLSKKTLAGLKEAQYVKPTVIQRESILAGLRGKDILAAAKTGSGKTLAFVIPVLERLFVEKWSRMDGLGALIITPTRELALQIFATVSQVGNYHDFTIGLIIGGQNLKYERNRLHNLNIIIGTPGRLLQHMDQNPLFDATNLKVVVMDEADRCLDMGFLTTMKSIIENLPTVRQTLLFSATRINSVREIAELNLRDPVHIAPHDGETIATPSKLQQSYVVVDLPAKLTMLWSFLHSHPKQKIIVFFATCKQVKYFYLIFKKLRPTVLLLQLYGGMNQEKRNKVYAEFCNRKSNICMLATDVASRGLDFPRVNWVVQMDCPEDVNQYIHRAGRTARLNTSGESLLVLLAHEEKAMLATFNNSRIPIKRITIDSRQLFSPLLKIQALLAQSPELKDCAKRAFVAYIKSVALMNNKEVFKLQKMNLDEFAKSLGLSVTPRVRFLSRVTDDCKPTLADDSLLTKHSKHRIEEIDSGKEDSDSDNFFTVKRVKHPPNLSANILQNNKSESSEVSYESLDNSTSVHKKRTSKIKMAKKALITGKHTTYDDDGYPVEIGRGQSLYGSYDFEKARLDLAEQDAADKERYKKIMNEKRKLRNQKERQKLNDECDAHDDFDCDNDTSIDLEWLPDPDKFCKTNIDTTSFDLNNQEKMQQPQSQRKRTLYNTHNMSLNETEQLALNLME